MKSLSSLRSMAITKMLLRIIGVAMLLSPAEGWGTPHDSVIPLDGSNLQSSIDDPANPLWLLKFYAPWCGHCKKLAPVLDKVAPVVQGKLAIGKIDCTVDKKTCDQHKVRGYPTLKFSMDGQIYDYPGGRKADDIIAFSEKMNRPAVQDVASVSDVWTYAETQTDVGVVFVAYIPSAPEGEEEPDATCSTVTQVFAQVARKQRAMDHFLQLSSAAADVASAGIPSYDASSPFVCRLEQDVSPKCVENLTSMTTESLLDFVQANNLATVSSLGPHNFRKVGHAGRPLVIGVVESSNTAQSADVKKALLEYATTGEYRESYYFGWLDGKIWNKFLAQFNVNESPQIFVLNVPDKVFWQNATYGLNVADFVAAVQDGTIAQGAAGAQGMQRYLQKAYHLMVQYRPWSVIVLVLSVIAVAILIATLVAPGDDPDPRLMDSVFQEESEGDAAEDKPAESKKDK